MLKESMTSAQFVELVISKAMEPVEMDPIPYHNRFKLLNSITFVNTVPRSVVAREIGELDFWNEIEGFVISNVKAGRRMYDSRTSYFDIPECGALSSRCAGNTIMFAIGDRIVDENYKIYKVVGFINSDGSCDVYCDVK